MLALRSDRHDKPPWVPLSLQSRYSKAQLANPLRCGTPTAQSFGAKNNFKAPFGTLSKINSLFAAWRIVQMAEEVSWIGAAMRRIIQEWIVLKEHETVYDVLLDATMALFSAAVATEVIQIIFSTL